MTPPHFCCHPEGRGKVREGRCILAAGERRPVGRFVPPPPVKENKELPEARDKIQDNLSFTEHVLFQIPFLRFLGHDARSCISVSSHRPESEEEGKDAEGRRGRGRES